MADLMHLSAAGCLAGQPAGAAAGATMQIDQAKISKPLECKDRNASLAFVTRAVPPRQQAPSAKVVASPRARRMQVPKAKLASVMSSLEAEFRKSDASEASASQESDAEAQRKSEASDVAASQEADSKTYEADSSHAKAAQPPNLSPAKPYPTDAQEHADLASATKPSGLPANSAAPSLLEGVFLMIEATGWSKEALTPRGAPAESPPVRELSWSKTSTMDVLEDVFGEDDMWTAPGSQPADQKVPTGRLGSMKFLSAPAPGPKPKAPKGSGTTRSWVRNRWSQASNSSSPPSTATHAQDGFPSLPEEGRPTSPQDDTKKDDAKEKATKEDAARTSALRNMVIPAQVSVDPETHEMRRMLDDGSYVPQVDVLGEEFAEAQKQAQQRRQRSK